MEILISLFTIIFGIYVLFILAIKIINRINMVMKCTEEKEATLIEIKAFGQKEDYEIEDRRSFTSKIFDKIFIGQIGRLMDLKDYVEHGVTPFTRLKDTIHKHLYIKNWDKWTRFSRRGKFTFQHVGREYTTDLINIGGAPKGLKVGDTTTIYVNLNNLEEAVIKSKKANGRFVGQLATCVVVFLLMVVSQKVLGQTLFWSPTSTNNKKTVTYANQPVSHVTAKPESYTMVDVDYFGVIKKVPNTFSKPIYAGNSEKSGKCTFYHKDMHEKICVVDIKDYEDKEFEINSIKYYMEKEVGKEAMEYSDEVTINNSKGELKIVKFVFEEEYLGDNYCVYGGYWFHNGKRYLFIHYTSREQLSKMAQFCMNNME